MLGAAVTEVPWTMRPHRGKHNSLFRRFTEFALNSALLRGWVASWSYRRGLHGKLRVTRHEIRLGNKHSLPAPLAIAFASDFHAGPTTHPEAFATLAEELREQRPDVILLGGDFVSGRARNVAAIAEVLSRCNPPLGKYAVLGNHDLWTDDEHIVAQLTGVGVEVLVNRSYALPAPFESISIIGIDDPWTGTADLRKAFAGAGPIRIFLTHSPDGLLLLGEERFDVGFAGHTHGGQVVFPDGTPVLSAGGPLSRAYGHGRFEIAGNGPLIVSRGIGCSNLPLRINADPELVICTLHP
jgi:predicted MPP superfamily phosphohydrolase